MLWESELRSDLRICVCEKTKSQSLKTDRMQHGLWFHLQQQQQNTQTHTNRQKDKHIGLICVTLFWKTLRSMYCMVNISRDIGKCCQQYILFLKFIIKIICSERQCA